MAGPYKLHGYQNFQGLRIAIENPKGGIRSGVDATGKPWRTVMKFPYGYFVGSEGSDGEEIDCFVGPSEKAENAYVVHQKKDNGSFDEDKVMLGFDSEEEAKKGYLSNYDTDKYLGPISTVPMTRLKALLAEDKPLKKISKELRMGKLNLGISDEEFSFADQMGRELARSDAEKFAQVGYAQQAGTALAKSAMAAGAGAALLGEALKKGKALALANPGAAVGGALGLAHGLQKDEHGNRHLLRGALEGAAGAAAGHTVGKVAPQAISNFKLQREMGMPVGQSLMGVGRGIIDPSRNV